MKSALKLFRPRITHRRHLNMFYLLDTSGSMNNADCIGQLNRAMREIIPLLMDVSNANRDQSDIYLSCISFGTQARMLYEHPVLINDFEWADVRAEGLTNLGEAFGLLDGQMTSAKTFGHGHGNLRSAVILMTDGEPDNGWREKLVELQENAWFREAYKIAIMVGPEALRPEVHDVMWRFAQPLDAGGEPIILQVNDLSRVAAVLKFVSSVVSRVGSRNYSASTDHASQIKSDIESAFEGDMDILYFPRTAGSNKPHY